MGGLGPQLVTILGEARDCRLGIVAVSDGDRPEAAVTGAVDPNTPTCSKCPTR